MKQTSDTVGGPQEQDGERSQSRRAPSRTAPASRTDRPTEPARLGSGQGGGWGGGRMEGYRVTAEGVEFF